jgi:hypothetical protein
MDCSKILGASSRKTDALAGFFCSCAWADESTIQTRHATMRIFIRMTTLLQTINL